MPAPQRLLAPQAPRSGSLCKHWPQKDRARVPDFREFDDVDHMPRIRGAHAPGCLKVSADLKKNEEGATKRTYIAALAITAALLLGSVSPDAGATVIYRWQPVNVDVSYPVPFYGTVAVTDAAYLAGSLDDYHFSRTDSYETYPSSPIVEVQFGGLPLHPRFVDGTNHWSVDAFVSFGDYLTGSLVVNTISDTYLMFTGGDTLWSVDFLSDLSEECHDPETPCSGATGYWVLDKSTIPVPEPDPFAALGFLASGLLGVDAARRWRRAHDTGRP